MRKGEIPKVLLTTAPRGEEQALTNLVNRCVQVFGEDLVVIARCCCDPAYQSVDRQELKAGFDKIAQEFGVDIDFDQIAPDLHDCYVSPFRKLIIKWAKTNGLDCYDAWIIYPGEEHLLVNGVRVNCGKYNLMFRLKYT